MKLDIMGLQFDNVTMDEASARAEQILAGKKTCYAVTPNAEIAYEALYDETLRALINGADLVLPATPVSAGALDSYSVGCHSGARLYDCSYGDFPAEGKSHRRDCDADFRA